MLAERGQKLRQLAERVVAKACETARLDVRDVLVEGVHEDPEREIALELRGAPVEHREPQARGAAGDLGQKAGLADPGLSRDQQRTRSSGRERREGAVQHRQFGDAPDEWLDGSGHAECAAASIRLRSRHAHVIRPCWCRNPRGSNVRFRAVAG